MKSQELKRELNSQNYNKEFIPPSRGVIGFLVFIMDFCLQDKYSPEVFPADPFSVMHSAFLVVLHDPHMKLSELGGALTWS